MLRGASISFPEEVFQGLEVTTEMLLSPVEVTARSFTLSQVQRQFYGKRASMRRITGPALPELEFKRRLARSKAKEVMGFDQRVALLAPPLLFQTRAQVGACSPVTAPFLEAQWKLVRAAHCPQPDACPTIRSPEHLSSCLGDGLGDALGDSYFGLMPSVLNGERGYADFLFRFVPQPLYRWSVSRCITTS